MRTFKRFSTNVYAVHNTNTDVLGLTLDQDLGYQPHTRNTIIIIQYPSRGRIKALNKLIILQ